MVESSQQALATLYTEFAEYISRLITKALNEDVPSN